MHRRSWIVVPTTAAGSVAPIHPDRAPKSVLVEAPCLGPWTGTNPDPHRRPASARTRPALPAPAQSASGTASSARTHRTRPLRLDRRRCTRSRGGDGCTHARRAIAENRHPTVPGDSAAGWHGGGRTVPRPASAPPSGRHSPTATGPGAAVDDHQVDRQCPASAAEAIRLCLVIHGPASNLRGGHGSGTLSLAITRHPLVRHQRDCYHGRADPPHTRGLAGLASRWAGAYRCTGPPFTSLGLR